MTDRVSRILLLTIDALRADHLSQYGYGRETMPVFNQLDDQATRYEAVFANGTNTGVSLPSLLTSQYHGTKHCKQGTTIATVLQDAGIRTAGFHSNTLFSNIVGRPRGFDDFEDFGVTEERPDEDSSSILYKIYECNAEIVKPILKKIGLKEVSKRFRDKILPAEDLHSMSYYINGEELTDAVINWLQEHSEESFFLWIHYLDPHRPYGIDLENPKYSSQIEKSEIRELMSKAGTEPSLISKDERNRIIDLYDSDLRYTSRNIRRLFDELENLGIYEDTSIVCTADHGEEFGEHGDYFHRNLPYDELLHVPLFIKGPNYANRQVSETKELLDIAPTICELMSVDRPQSFEGSPVSVVKDRQIIATGSFGYPSPVVAGRWNGWKYISTDTSVELYDLDGDPSEKNDISSKHPEILSEYREKLPNHLFAGNKESRKDTEDEVVKERLKGLGYLE